ncbi:hypothetical protein HGRIS_009383 [Hohenbuehelia grisea]|uniref:DUF396-domain-containing protein n=1 Tax=Hohenbuehelia grisea TaxID=104357 RepID=A0ABR3J1E2_9AGAR
MGMLYYMSYAAFLAAFGFVTLSLASGLLYISELIEEHSRSAKIVGERSVYVVIGLHLLLYFFDSLPLPQTVFSVMCHLVYLQNFSSSWPLISLSSLSFVASCALVIMDHFLWFFYFARITNEARHSHYHRGRAVPGFAEIATFFGLCVWLVPLFLFLSLSANDNALPVSANEPGTPPKKPLPAPRVSLFRSIVSNLSPDGVPLLRSRSRKTSGAGLIAPPSPIKPRSPLPASPSFPPPRYPKGTSPDQSPALSSSQSYLDSGSHLTPSSSFQLSTPPRRSPNLSRRQVVDTSVGLGLGSMPTSSSVTSSTAFTQ